MSMKIGIDPAIFTKFPEACVSFTLIDVTVFPGKAVPKPQGAYLSDLKQASVRSLLDRNISVANYLDLPVCKSWESVFGTMGASDKHSTIINLLRRATGEGEKLKEGKKADLGKISNFVDLYNCVSIQELTPMGAIDLAKVDGDITLRFGRAGDLFTGLGKDSVVEEVTPEQIVYADRSSVLTHLWNYRDAAHACVPREGATHILLFADQAHKGAGDAESAILRATHEMHHIGGSWLLMDKLSQTRPEVTLDLTELVTEGSVSVK